MFGATPRWGRTNAESWVLTAEKEYSTVKPTSRGHQNAVEQARSSIEKVESIRP
jgi:hypothetical protein